MAPSSRTAACSVVTPLEKATGPPAMEPDNQYRWWCPPEWQRQWIAAVVAAWVGMVLACPVAVAEWGAGLFVLAIALFVLALGRRGRRAMEWSVWCCSKPSRRAPRHGYDLSRFLGVPVTIDRPTAKFSRDPELIEFARTHFSD